MRRIKARVTTDDGAEIALGDIVWCNHLHVPGQTVPVHARLVGIRMNTVFPYNIEVEENTKTVKYWWEHVFSTRQAALADDPHPEISDIRRRLNELEQLLKTKKPDYCSGDAFVDDINSCS